MVGSLLQIKPVLTVGGGQIGLFAKPRTKGRAVRTMLDQMAERSRGRPLHVGILHADVLEEAEELRQEIEERFECVELFIAELTAVMGAHTGPGVLGVAFLIAGGAIFDWFGVTPPNHPGYVQFPAALLVVFAIMFAAIARNPAGNRDLIPYGMLLKVAYCGVVFRHWFAGGLPDMWKPLCIADLVFLVLFVWAWKSLRGADGPPE